MLVPTKKNAERCIRRLVALAGSLNSRENVFRFYELMCLIETGAFEQPLLLSATIRSGVPWKKRPEIPLPPLYCSATLMLEYSWVTLSEAQKRILRG